MACQYKPGSKASQLCLHLKWAATCCHAVLRVEHGAKMQNIILKLRELKVQTMQLAKPERTVTSHSSDFSQDSEG